MANQIQIKRSNVTANAANTLLAGELAFSYLSNSIFIGAQTGTTAANIRIGGEKYNFLDRASSGVIVANAALVTDANSFVNNVYTTGLIVQASAATPTSQLISSISNTANGSILGTNTSGGGISTELATTAAIVQYVSGRTGAAVGSNGQFLFNNSGVVTGTGNFTYDYTSNTITVGNSTVNVQLGYVTGGGHQLQHWHGNANTYTQIQLTNANTGTSASADLVINADNYTDSTNYIDLGINSSTWSNTEWTINGADDGYLYAANGTMAIGTASAKAIQFFVNGTLLANEAMRIDAGANVGIGTSTPNAKLSVAGTANVSGVTTLGSSLTVTGPTTLNGNVVVGTTSGISANGSYGSSGQVLVSNGNAVYWGTGTSGSNTQVQYNDSGVANASAGFTFTKTTNTLSIGNTISLGNSTVNSTANGTAIFIGNTTVNTSITAGAVSVNGVALITNSQAYTAFAQIAGSTSFTGNNTFGGTNTVINSNATIAGIAYFGSTVGSAIIPTANGSQDLGTANNRWGKLYLAGATIVLGNTTISSTGDALTANNLVVTTNATVNNIIGTTTNISSNLAITAANIVATSSFLSVRDVSVTGNLTVSGTLTTIDTVNLQVKDSMIKLADQNTGTDTIAIGIYGISGNATTTYYSGLYRDQSAGTLTSPVFKLFSSNTEPTTIVDNTALGYALATLNSYLNSGAFVANASVVNITANATVSSAIVANSLTLSTALAATSGGTGTASYAAGDVLYAANTTALSKLSVPATVANGQVLQIVNNLPAYGVLDGGTI